MTISSNLTIAASTDPIRDIEKPSVSATVEKLLKNHDFQLNKNINTVVQIFINKDDEMVVLSVNTENKAVKEYIKGRLNYKKVSKEIIGNSKSFKVPVRILKSK